MHQSGDLPENVLGKRTSGQVNSDGITHHEVARYLEDPNSVLSTGKGDARGNFHAGGPFVEPGFERQAADVTPFQFGEIRVFSSGGILICGFHVEDGRGQHGGIFHAAWIGAGSIYRINRSSHLFAG